VGYSAHHYHCPWILRDSFVLVDLTRLGAWNLAWDLPEDGVSAWTEDCGSARIVGRRAWRPALRPLRRSISLFSREECLTNLLRTMRDVSRLETMLLTWSKWHGRGWVRLLMETENITGWGLMRVWERTELQSSHFTERVLAVQDGASEASGPHPMIVIPNYSS